MTTIAIKDDIIAADGRRSWGSEIRGEGCEKIKIKHGRIYAFTGVVPMFDPLIEWHNAGANPSAVPPSKDCDWHLIVIDAAGVHKFSESCPHPEMFDQPVAFGAGGDYAMGAMLAGADARRAVEITASITTHTGGKITAVGIAEHISGWTSKHLLAAE